MADDLQNDKHALLFMHLVSSFQMSALQGLGKMVNPNTDKAEKDLNAASASIDMLDMLLQRTKGNLNEHEERMLIEMVSHLKLNYVEELNKPAPEPSSQSAEKTSSTEEEKPQSTSEDN